MGRVKRPCPRRVDAKKRSPDMTIVMGLDQHRAQITAEWLDTDTGEISALRCSLFLVDC
jgi:hypothetical protein